MRAHRVRSVPVRLLLALTVVAAAELLVAPVASAATVVKLNLNSRTVTIDTSTGHKLRLAVAAFKDISKGNRDKVAVNVTLSTGKAVGLGETHVWSFQAPRSAFVYHRHSGRGSLATAEALGDFGSLSLSFDKTKKDYESCAVHGSMTTFTGTLRGAVHFRSSTPWGRFNKRHMIFATPNTVVIDHNCEQGDAGEEEDEEGACEESISWSGPSATVADGVTTEYGSVIFTDEKEDRPRITGVRTLDLSAPSSAARADYLVALSEPPRASGDTLTIPTKSGKDITGIATISGGQEAPPVTGECEDASGQMVPREQNGFYGAAWSSPADAPLTFDFAATPDFVAPTSGSATWTHTTFGNATA